MINIFSDLAELDLPIYVEGDAPEDLPSEYYTISEDSTTDNLNADNKTVELLYEYTLKWFTTDNSSRVYEGLNNAIRLLKSKGYIIDGIGYHNNANNGWYSRQVDVEKLETIEEE